MSWTDERIATLTKMWEGGSTASQIAEELGISKSAAGRYMKQLDSLSHVPSEF